MPISERVGWETVWQAEVASFSPEKRQFLLRALIAQAGGVEVEVDRTQGWGGDTDGDATTEIVLRVGLQESAKFRRGPALLLPMEGSE